MLLYFDSSMVNHDCHHFVCVCVDKTHLHGQICVCIESLCMYLCVSVCFGFNRLFVLLLFFI